MSAWVPSTPSSSRAASHYPYLEFLRLGVFDIVGLVDALLLETYFVRVIRESTGAFWGGAGLGGMGKLYIYLNRTKLQSIPVSLLLFLQRNLPLLIFPLALTLTLTLFLLLFSLFVLLPLSQSRNLTVFYRIDFVLDNHAFLITLLTTVWTSKYHETAPIQP
jgi:hypothetical protein